MSVDKREAILQRLFAILLTVEGAAVVEGVPSVFRNRGEVPEDKLPAAILLDGREEIARSASGKGGILAPTVFTLRPQVFVVLKPREDVNNDSIGQDLSAWRMRLLRAFARDEELIGMLGANGEVQYLGHETDMQTGSTMLGQMQMLFSLTYVLSPNDY